MTMSQVRLMPWIMTEYTLQGLPEARVFVGVAEHEYKVEAEEGCSSFEWVHYNTALHRVKDLSSDGLLRRALMMVYEFVK